MIKSTFYLQILIPNYEDAFFNYNLNYFTKFNTSHSLLKNKCKKISLNFGFKDIKFEKKQMILYFFLLELLSNQKCILTISRKNLINLKIKRGSISGCKVTLRNNALHSFLDTLMLSLPRAEIFKGFIFKTHSLKKNTYSTQLKNLFIFYTLESDFVNYVKHLDITFTFTT